MWLTDIKTLPKYENAQLWHFLCCFFICCDSSDWTQYFVICRVLLPGPGADGPDSISGQASQISLILRPQRCNWLHRYVISSYFAKKHLFFCEILLWRLSTVYRYVCIPYELTYHSPLDNFKWIFLSFKDLLLRKYAFLLKFCIRLLLK